MAHYIATVSAPIAIDVAFDHLARFSSCEQWDPGVVEASQLTPDPVGLGSRFEVVARVAGREVPLTYEITTYERPTRVTVRAERPPTVSEDTITFTASDDASHTTVRYEADLRVEGPFALLGPVVGLLFDRIGDRAARGLRAWLLELADRRA
jgi:hypothetical protein